MLATTWLTRQLVFNGVISGLVIGLLAMGIVLVYRATKVLNFAVGNIGLIGATLLSILVIRYHVPFWISVPISLIVGTAFAVAVELTVIRRLFKAPRVTVLVATIGIAGLALAIASALPSLGSSSAGYPVASSGDLARCRRIPGHRCSALHHHCGSDHCDRAGLVPESDYRRKDRPRIG